MTTLNITATLTVEQLTAKIEEVTQAERITKEGLSVLSRELLAHVWTTGDVQPINMLMGTADDGKFRLTPLNWRTAAMYFNAMVAFTSNYEKEVKAFAEKGEGSRVPLTFNKKSKKKYQELGEKVESWLALESNDIWLWSADVTLSDPTKDYGKLAVTAVGNALDEEKGSLSPLALLAQLVDNVDELDLTVLRQFVENPRQGFEETSEEQAA